MVHTMEFRVRTYECDSYQHVNNAVYLNYLEMARQEFLIAGGLDYEKMRKLGQGIIIKDIHIHFIKPAHSGEILSLQTSTLELKLASGTLLQKIFRGTELLTEATVGFVHINEKGRPSKLPQDFGDPFFQPAQST